MSLSVIAQGGDLNRPHGYCSRCHKVWTLNERQGVCQWCGKPASCNNATSKPRRIKSRSNDGRKQQNGNGNGYDHLQGEWLTYYKVASRFSHKAQAQDRGDLLHDIMVALTDVASHKSLTEPAMYRIASITVADYWREHYRHTSGLDCGHCSNPQRKKCRKHWLYGECPKAIKIERLSRPVIDADGNLTELGNLIADDTALDIPQWLEINEQLLHTPDRALAIAGKIQDGEHLTPAESRYLYKVRRKYQKSLF